MNVLSGVYNAAFGRKIENWPSPMEVLPQDIIVLILQSIDSLRTLRAAVLASSAMHDAFKIAKIETLACVVARSRPKEVEADAEALSVILYLHNQSNRKISTALLKHNLWNPQKEWACMPRTLSSPQLLHFHWFVEYFTEKIFKSTMRRVYEKGWLGSKKLRFRRLSHNETVRIQRALYRLEFFNYYLELVRDPRELMRSPYWQKRVTVWDMEEIACVQTLISERMTVLDDTLKDITHHVEVQVSLLKGYVKCCLMSQGLGTLFHVLSGAETQNTRRILRDTLQDTLEPKGKRRNMLFDMGQDFGSSVPHFMFKGIGTEDPCTLHIDKLLYPQEGVDYPSYGYARVYKKLTTQLVTTGSMSSEVSSLYNEKSHHMHRKWGYCLWDKDRMQYWGKDRASSVRKQVRLQEWTTIRLN